MKPAGIVESILFAAGHPVSRADLSSAAGLEKGQLDSVLKELEARLASGGLRLVADKRTVQLVTAPEAATHVARYVQAERRGTLSRSALETLAIIAYRGPVTRPEIEAIRGVSSDGPVRTLSIRGLVREVGHKPGPGRPILYDTTLELLKHLGVRSKSDLPPLPEPIQQKLEAKAEATAS